MTMAPVPRASKLHSAAELAVGEQHFGVGVVEHEAIASASRRVLSVFRTAPAMATPKCASYIAGTLGSIAATVSSLPMPRAFKADASCLQRE